MNQGLCMQNTEVHDSEAFKIRVSTLAGIVGNAGKAGK